LGGLSRTTASVAQVLDAAGFELILIETVGAGQSEIEVARLAHTVVVVEAPGLGDDIQAIKAGILEIADILVVNKCDLPGADRTARALSTMLEMAHPTRPGSISGQHFWQPPVIMACTTGCQGISETVEAIGKHRSFLERSGQWQHRERERLQAHLEALLRDTLMERLRARIQPEEYASWMDKLADRQVSPFAVMQHFLDE
jgi:LAO/AO transport system kinase